VVKKLTKSQFIHTRQLKEDNGTKT